MHSKETFTRACTCKSSRVFVNLICLLLMMMLFLEKKKIKGVNKIRALIRLKLGLNLKWIEFTQFKNDKLLQRY